MNKDIKRLLLHVLNNEEPSSLSPPINLRDLGYFNYTFDGHAEFPNIESVKIMEEKKSILFLNSYYVQINVKLDEMKPFSKEHELAINNRYDANTEHGRKIIESALFFEKQSHAYDESRRCARTEVLGGLRDRDIEQAFKNKCKSIELKNKKEQLASELRESERTAKRELESKRAIENFLKGRTNG